MVSQSPNPPCREADITKERIAKILGAGANVILTTGGIDDLCLKYFVEAHAMAVRRCKKEDLKRIARATGGNVSSSFSNIAYLRCKCLPCQ
jgi:T-complex protein 1 subunit alpha